VNFFVAWRWDGAGPIRERQLLALSGHPNSLTDCLLSGVKRTSREDVWMSAFDIIWMIVSDFAGY